MEDDEERVAKGMSPARFRHAPAGDTAAEARAAVQFAEMLDMF